MEFTIQERDDLLQAISTAMDELCVGPGFPEATAYFVRLEKLVDRLVGLNLV